MITIAATALLSLVAYELLSLEILTEDLFLFFSLPTNLQLRPVIISVNVASALNRERLER